MNTRKVWTTLLAFTLIATLAGCGGKRTEVVTWWTAPDRVGSEDLAQACSNVARGYRIEVHALPPTLSQRRAELIRRLSVGDDGVDVVTVDSALTSEFATAGYLAPLPADLKGTAGMISTALAGSSSHGTLVTVPWWVDPYVLWFRGAAAERVGIDTTKPVAWEKLLAGADRVRASVQFDDADGTGLSDWVRGLVGESGGSVLRGAGRTPEVGLNSQAGRAAAGAVQYYAASGLGTGPSDQATIEFAGSRGAFLVARASVRSAQALSTVAADMKPLPYPVMTGASAAPLVGAGLGVAKSSQQGKAAWDAVRCLSSSVSERALMVNAGVGAARESVYSEESVTQALPFAKVLLAAVKSGVPAPESPYWHDAERAIHDSWTPLTSVRAADTPAASDAAVTAAVRGGL